MLQEDYLSVQQAQTVEEFQTGIVRFARRLGFETIGATTIVDRLDGKTDFLNVDNMPEGYRETSADLSRSRVCPVAQHCKHTSVPIIWNQETYVAAGRAALWECQASFGYGCGIALAMHLPKGLHFMLGVDRDQALPSCSAEVSRMAAAVQLFAVHAQDAAARLLLPQCASTSVPELTPRELECLRWTMEGKTAWELGRILGIAEQTAVRHVHNASKKLQCVNKHQAVLKALRLKLIW